MPIRCTGRRSTPISARPAGANCTRAGEVVASRARLAHRPAASLGPDEGLAGELEASAQAAATAACDAGASAWALEQAAALSPAAQGRESRLLDAAVVLLNAADTSAAALVLASCQVTSARRDAITRLLGYPPDRPARRVACSPRGRPTTRGPRVKPERVPRHPGNWMVLSGRPDQALTWADRAVSGTVPGSALRAMARTAQAYAFAAASRSPEGLAALGFLPVSAGPRPAWRCSLGVPRGAARRGLPSGQHQGVRALPAVQRRRDHRGAGKLFGGHQLGPWTGFAVLCGYAVVLTGLAAWRLRRRDA